MCAVAITDEVATPVRSARVPYKASCTPLPELFAGPAVQELEYLVYGSIREGVEALDAGAVDLVDFPIPADMTVSEEISLESCRDFGFHYVAFNNRTGPFRWKGMRKGVAFLLDPVKRSAKARLGADRVELMRSLMVQYYGRLVNPFVPSYATEGSAEAIRRGLEAMALDGFDIGLDWAKDPDGSDIPSGSIRCLVPVDDPVARTVMEDLESVLRGEPRLARLFVFEDVTRNEAAARVFGGASQDWHVYPGWNYVQDNLSRWNPGMSKLRLSLDWVADYQSGNSQTRNFVGFQSPQFDQHAERFLTTLRPRDLRGAVITEEHLDPRWNNSDFWNTSGNVSEGGDALFQLWKLQWILADEAPLVPLFARSVTFARRSDVAGVWNGEPSGSFTYPGGLEPIASTYPGGPLSYWTFQRIHHEGDDTKPIKLAITNNLRHLNPLGVGNYFDALIWSRIYESLLGLNPFLLTKGVAEDAVNLARSFSSELVSTDGVRQILTFSVRPDISWHDGETLSGRDVAFTFLSMLGARGRLIAQRDPSTTDLLAVLVNDVPVAAWVDLAKWIHHVRLADEQTVEVYLTHASRYTHEWFGDMPIVPLHVWKHLGPDFTDPSYRGARGLYAIRDDSRGEPRQGFTGWHGLVGTGPFMWAPNSGSDPMEALTHGGRLIRFPGYHGLRELEPAGLAEAAPVRS